MRKYSSIPIEWQIDASTQATEACLSKASYANTYNPLDKCPKDANIVSV